MDKLLHFITSASHMNSRLTQGRKKDRETGLGFLLISILQEAKPGFVSVPCVPAVGWVYSNSNFCRSKP
jgi:hypothetical protein